MIKILVGVVTYNRYSLLKRCIEHINKQKYNFNELLIVDNGSTDETHNYLSEKYNLCKLPCRLSKLRAIPIISPSVNVSKLPPSSALLW